MTFDKNSRILIGFPPVHLIRHADPHGTSPLQYFRASWPLQKRIYHSKVKVTCTNVE